MPFVDAEFVITLTAPAAGLGGKLPAAWEVFGDPAQALDRAQQTFQAAVDRSSRPIVALVRFRFTDHPDLGRRLAVAGVEAWHGPLGLLPGVQPAADCWRGMEAAALLALLAHLGLGG
jgi:hypothetical protein